MSDSGDQARSLERLKQLDREIHLLEHVTLLVQWDQETYMPPGAVEERGDQLCLLYTSPSPRDGLLSRMPSSA